jgi:hypothetical protein
VHHHTRLDDESAVVGDADHDLISGVDRREDVAVTPSVLERLYTAGLMKVVLCALVASSAAQAAPPAGFRESSKLEPVASYIGGRHATVWCAETQEAFEAVGRIVPGGFEAAGFAYPTRAEAYFRPETCQTLRSGFTPRSATG